jgi:uroporphyrinogen decarboxylase
MTRKENFLSLLKRQGYNKVPVEFMLCPSLVEEYRRQTKSEKDYNEYFGIPWKNISDGKLMDDTTDKFRKYFKLELKAGTKIDIWGVAHELGSEAAKHMTYMRNPLKTCEDIQEILEYPFPDYENAGYAHQSKEIEEIHSKDLAAVGYMPCTIWETAWYIRGMEELMMDMLMEDPKAEAILDKVTNLSIIRAQQFALAGADILFLGDDIGMQKSIMMSEDLYCTWLKPRLKKVITAAKAIKPDIIVFYHSCGFITPFIPHLIESGIDVLNPIQPECMNFEEIHKEYGEKLSFHGTIGTQTVMPFGTPEEVRKEVFKNLQIAGDKGGLFIAPTHLLEPEVPWDNIIAYVKACEDFK